MPPHALSRAILEDRRAVVENRLFNAPGDSLERPVAGDSLSFGDASAAAASHGALSGVASVLHELCIVDLLAVTSVMQVHFCRRKIRRGKGR